MKKVICAVIFNFNGELLITRRSKGEYKGQWEFPGGKVEDNESNTDCLFRELSEELNVKVQIHNKFTEFEYQYPDFRVNLISYICSMKDQKIELVDHDMYKWIEVRNVDLYNFLLADKAILNKLKQNSHLILKKISERFGQR
jgi:8-oxo-dGTP diphosphatase